MTHSEGGRRPLAVVSANSAWNIVNFRGPVIAALIEQGWDVAALAGEDGHGDAIASLGARFIPLRIDSSGMSVLRDTRLLLDYHRILRELRPQAFLGFTVKPNIYGSLAARLLSIKVINNISGLGTAFIRPGLLNRLVTGLYRLALGSSDRVFFQNPDDRDLFLAKGLVRPGQARLVPGSGVDLEHFHPGLRRPGSGRPFRFLFVGRLLKDKGLVEYAEAARLLRNQLPDAEFAILGFAGADNRSAVPIEQVERWQSEGIVNYLGATSDVRPILEETDCVVLPSYREGLPRSLLEAAAMGLPMIATDVPGCRDVVTPGENGLLCEVRSAASLAAAMEAMIRLDPEARGAMGDNARAMVELRFDQALVARAYVEALA